MQIQCKINLGNLAVYIHEIDKEKYWILVIYLDHIYNFDTFPPVAKIWDAMKVS